MQLIEYLSGFITRRRFELFNRVLEYRTRYLTVALEDIYQPQNASAVLRTCDCTGIQDVHIIENMNEYEVNTDVALGSEQWLTLYRYNRPDRENTSRAIRALRDQGYRIVATVPGENGMDPFDFPIGEGKAALLFGTELTGLSDEALEQADRRISIPMWGFTESYNLSVSASIILFLLRKKLEESGTDWKLNPSEKEALLLEWLRSSIKKVELIEQQFRIEQQRE